MSERPDWLIIRAHQHATQCDSTDTGQPVGVCVCSSDTHTVISHVSVSKMSAEVPGCLTILSICAFLYYESWSEFIWVRLKDGLKENASCGRDAHGGCPETGLCRCCLLS